MNKHIVFVGGGTAGHITPLLAVMAAAQELAKKENITLRCTYIGLPSDLDSPLIIDSPLSFEKYGVRSGKLHRHLTINQVKQVIHLVRGIGEARKVLAKLKPDLIFAKGGYVTIPIVRAAVKMKIPLYCHESDVVIGLANRLVVKHATKVFTTYPASAYPQLAKDIVIETGQPVREMFYKRAKELPIGLDSKVPFIVVIGGSQGAHRINELIEESWNSLLPSFQIVQVTGPADHAMYVEKRKELSKDLQSRLLVEPFLKDELPALFQKAAVVVTRAGGTIAELAASRSCTLLLPLSTSAQQHQQANARVLVKAGAALSLDETKTTSKEIVKIIKRLDKDTSEQTSLRSSIGAFDHPDAARKMAAVLLEA
jgi:UDP-N-acetylglucosamine--N-acetylmuramyl-(pentapeptide) pyrophosphoryl-undecaprenol N-acetylglucosamine transferase